MAWESWLPTVGVLAAVGGIYYLMAKNGISCCGTMSSSQGCHSEEPSRPQQVERPLKEPVSSRSVPEIEDLVGKKES